MVDIDIRLSYIVSLENFREALFYLYTKYLLEPLELFHFLFNSFNSLFKLDYT